MTSLKSKKVMLKRVVNERKPFSTDEKALMCKIRHKLKEKTNDECCKIFKDEHGIHVKPNTFTKIVKTLTKWL